MDKKNCRVTIDGIAEHIGISHGSVAKTWQSFYILAQFLALTVDDGLPFLGLSRSPLKLESSSSPLILDIHFLTELYFVQHPHKPFPSFLKCSLVVPPPKQRIQSQLFASDGHPMITSFQKWLTGSAHIQTKFFNSLSLNKYFNYTLLKFQ